MDWTPEKIAELTNLWAEGLTGSEIGKRLGISKSAAVGKAHRLSLPGRPSPINRSGPKALRQIGKRAAAPNDPPRRVRATPTVRPPKPYLSRAQASGFTPDPGKTVTSPSIRGRCNWPLWGDQEKPTHQYCGHDTAPGQTLCEPHRVIASSGAAKISDAA